MSLGSLKDINDGEREIMKSIDSTEDEIPVEEFSVKSRLLKAQVLDIEGEVEKSDEIIIRNRAELDE